MDIHIHVCTMCVCTEPLPKCEHGNSQLICNVCGLCGFVLVNEYLHCVAMDNWIHRDSGNCNLDSTYPMSMLEQQN